jgi:phosphoglycolate phosphatase
MIRTVLFDLDGTLLDTAPDLAYALNTVREEQQREPLPFETIRPQVSHGSLALMRLGFADLAEDSEDFQQLRQRLLTIYKENIANLTRPFPGIAELLDILEQRQLRWGVVTNKPSTLTEPLLEALDLLSRCACVVSGDTLEQRKPHPAPMLHACRLADCEAEQCLYVGDARRDIEAGQRAGMPTLVALFGYIDAAEDPATWGADAMVNRPDEILQWLDARNSQS